jgi:hypothetical protein
VKSIRDAIQYQYQRSLVEPKQLIERELISDLVYDAAEKENYELRADVKNKLRNAMDVLIHQKLYSDEVKAQVTVDSLEVEQYYKKHWAEYKDKSFDEVYVSLRNQLRDEKIASLRAQLLESLREKYNPELNEAVVARLLKEES